MGRGNKGHQKSEHVELESEAKFREVFEECPDAIFLADAQSGIIIDANRGACELMGMPRAEILGLHQSQLHPPEEGKRYRAIFREHVEKGEAITQDIHIQRPSGELVPVDISAKVIDVSGKQILQGVFRDITDRKRTEEALRESEEKLKAQYKAIPVPTYTWQRIGEDFVLVDYNDAAVAITQGNVATFLGEKATEMYQDRPEIVEQLSRCFAEKAPVKREIEYRFAITGESKHLAVTYVSVPPDLVMVHTEDITERKQAEEEILRRTEELAALNEIGQAIGSTLNLTQVLKLVAQKTAQVCDVERCSILLLDKEKKELVPMMSQFGSGVAGAELWRIFKEETYAEKVDDVPAVKEVIRERKTVVLDEESKSRLPQRWTEPFGIKSLLLVPLISKDETIGLMALDYTTEGKHFSAEVVNLASTMGSQIGIAIENASLYQEERRRLSEMEALRQTTLDITRQLDMQQLLRSIVEQAAALVGTKGGGLYLYHPEEEELELVVSYYLDKDYTGMRLKVGEGLSGKVMLTGQPLIIEDYASWEGGSDKYDGAPFRGVMAVPLKWGQKILGVINVTDVEQPRSFTDRDLSLLELFANQAAIAIQNARLYEQAQARSAYLETLQRINATLRSTLPLSQVLETIVQGTTETLGYVGSLIAVPDQRMERLTAGAVWGNRFVDAALRVTGLKVESLSLPSEAKENPIARAFLTGELQTWSGAPERIVMGVEPPISSQLARTMERTMGAKLAACVPLRVAKKTVGVLVVFSPKEQLPDDERAMLLGLANQAGLAIENASLHEETKRRLEELSATEEIVHELSSTLDFQKVIQLVVDKAIEATDASAGLIAVLNEERMGTLLLAQRGYPVQVEAYRHRPWSIRGGIVGRVVRTGELSLVDDVTKDPDYAEVIPETRSQLTVPIVQEDKVAGAIVLESPQLGDFTKEEARFVQHLAEHAAVAMENARLYERLRKSEERYRTYVENVPDAIWETDAKGHFTYWSPQIKDLTGYTSEELLGHTAHKFLIHPDDVDGFRNEARQMLEEGREEYTLTHHALHRDGSILHLETSIRPVRDDAGKVIKFQGVAREVSDRVFLRAQLIQSAKLSAIGQMISGVAHELNNPLTTVMGYTQLLQASDVDERVKDDLQRIYEDALRAQRIVQNLLTFARQKKPRRTLVDINEAIEQTLALRIYQFKVDNVEVVKELADNLPWTMADASQLQQVFLNIINNAHQAIVDEKGGGILTVRSELLDDDIIRVSFGDTGPGIPPEILDRVFDPFFTTKDVGAGTGLGLSVSHGIVQEHDGRIWAETEPGQGATFFVELPVKSWVEDITLPYPNEEPEPRPSESQRILVIDDERNIVDLIVRVLKESGYRVEGVTSARLALKRLHQEQYNLIISDIKMPGMDGPRCEKEVRAMDPALAERIIFITGDLLSPTTRAFLERWDGKRIKKPFNVEELKALVLEALS